MNSIRNFFRDETGLELSEYVVAAALVALVILVAFTNLGVVIANKISMWMNNASGR
jgi:Flp pilus assembly pilin Flp